jgi:hypothetical protein
MIAAMFEGEDTLTSKVILSGKPGCLPAEGEPA